MKKLLLLLLCVHLLFSCEENEKNKVSENKINNKKIIADLLQMNLKGKVKSIISLSSDSTRYYFNKFGSITKIITKKEEDNYVFKNHFENNQKISQYFYTEENGIIDSVLKTTFKYNNGYLIEKKEKNSKKIDFWGEQKVTKYEYDNDGNEIKSSTYCSDGVLRQERISEWNNIGQKIRYKLYSLSYISTSEDDLSLIYTWTYTYNDNGHEKSIDFKGWKGEQTKTNFYDYEIDINGNWIKRTNQEISNILYYGEDNAADTSISYEERIINYFE